MRARTRGAEASRTPHIHTSSMGAPNGSGYVLPDSVGGKDVREPNDVTPCDAAEVSNWDHTVDVVVVGFGAAGSCAAFSAAEAGAEVLVAERTGGPGGAAALAEGIVYLGGGTPIQQACGFSDTVD